MNKYAVSGYRQLQTFLLTCSLLLFFGTASYSTDGECAYVPMDTQELDSLKSQQSASISETAPEGVSRDLQQPESLLPSPLRLQRRRSSLLNSFTAPSEFGVQTFSLQTYGAAAQEGLTSNEKKTAWDDPSKFAFFLDKDFFVQADSKTIAFGLFMALIGIVPSSPSCGYVMYNVANFTHIPLPDTDRGGNPAYSNAAIAWITISTAPVFMMAWYLAGKELFQTGKKLLQRCKGRCQKQIPLKRELDNQPHLLDESTLHKVLKIFCFVSAATCAAVPTTLLYAVEHQYRTFFWITVAPFYFTWLGTYWNETLLGLDQFFQKKFYRSQSALYKLKILRQKNDAFKNVFPVAEESFIQKAFSYVRKAPPQEFSEDDPFVFSLFFVKDQRRADREVDQKSAALLNFRMDMETVRPSESTDFISTLMAGAALYAKFYIMQYVLENAFLSMGVEEKRAEIASKALSTFEALFRTILMNGMQKRFLQGLPKVFSSKHSNYRCIRKIAGMTAGINAVLFSLPMVVAGMEVYKDSSAFGKFFHIFPAFLNDLAFYDQIFNTYSNYFLTYVLTLKPKEIKNLERMKAFVSYWADEASKRLVTFDDPTIDEIYHRTQEGT